MKIHNQAAQAPVLSQSDAASIRNAPELKAFSAEERKGIEQYVNDYTPQVIDFIESDKAQQNFAHGRKADFDIKLAKMPYETYFAPGAESTRLAAATLLGRAVQNRLEASSSPLQVEGLNHHHGSLESINWGGANIKIEARMRIRPFKAKAQATLPSRDAKYLPGTSSWLKHSGKSATVAVRTAQVFTKSERQGIDKYVADYLPKVIAFVASPSVKHQLKVSGHAKFDIKLKDMPYKRYFKPGASATRGAAGTALAAALSKELAAQGLNVEALGYHADELDEINNGGTSIKIEARLKIRVQAPQVES